MDFSIICVTHTGVGEEAIKDCLAMNDLKELNSLDFMKYDRPKNKEEKVAFADKYYKILEEKIDKNKIGPGTIILVDFPGCYSAAVSTKFALKRKDVCVNCISKQAYIRKGQAFKLEFVDYDIYAIIAQYVEVDERPWVLELVYKTKEDIILGAHGKTRFLENIVTYNKEYYTDVLTNAYSRRYYEEYVQYINDVSAVAMIDADNFKAINDQYGHNAGDQAIKAVSKAIQSCIRADDIFIRYGGDEFLLVFQDIHYDTFTTRLYQISECVKQTKVDDYEDLSLSITVGGIYGNSKVNDAIKKADKLMYEGKKSKRSIVVKKTSEVD